MAVTVTTARLELIRGDAALLASAAAMDDDGLSRSLNARIPPDWPPLYLDQAALRWTLDKVTRTGDGWWAMWFVVLNGQGNGPRLLVGSMGFKGPPRGDGTVEIGYGIVSSHHRRGLCSEGVTALIAWAWRQPGVGRITAHTLPDGVASIGVVKKAGFRLVGAGEEEGAILWELPAR